MSLDFSVLDYTVKIMQVYIYIFLFGSGHVSFGDRSSVAPLNQCLSIRSPLQPVNQWEPDGAESDGDGESGAASDGLIYQQSDYEEEAEEDTWFDDFLSSGLAASPDRAEEAPQEPEPAKHGPKAADSDSQHDRPVARPLAGHDLAANHDRPKVLLIEDSPVKVECHEVDESSAVATHSIMVTKEQEARALREQIAELERQMEQSKFRA